MYTVDEIKKSAWDNEDAKDDYNLAELLYFSTLRGIAVEYKAGRISKETLKHDSHIAQQNYRVMCGMTNRFMKGEVSWKYIESAATEFMKNKTIENAVKFHAAVYNLKE